MDRLDDFIKGKMDQREFEFNEAHWMNATQMIDAQEKKRRKGFWLWLFFGMILILGVVDGIWNMNSLHISEKADETQMVVDNQTLNPAKNFTADNPIADTTFPPSPNSDHKNSSENTVQVTENTPSNNTVKAQTLSKNKQIPPSSLENAPTNTASHKTTNNDKPDYSEH